MSYRPNHRLDTTTGWHVLAETPDTVTSYGPDGIYQFKWHDVPTDPKDPATYYRHGTNISLSIDGQNWHTDNSFWAVYYTVFNRTCYNDKTHVLNKALLEARAAWRAERSKRLAREARAAFKALPREEQTRIENERAEALRERRAKIAERNAVKTQQIMKQMLYMGPELVRLKDKIDALIDVMGKGGMDRPLGYFHSYCQQINHTTWHIEKYRRDIEEAQKRTASKRKR